MFPNDGNRLISKKERTQHVAEVEQETNVGDRTFLVPAAAVLFWLAKEPQHHLLVSVLKQLLLREFMNAETWKHRSYN